MQTFYMKETNIVEKKNRFEKSVEKIERLFCI